MGINPRWLAQLVIEDEYGEPEKWEFHFKRPTSRAMLAFSKAKASEDAEAIEFILEAVDGIMGSVRRNGEESSIASMPFEMFEEVLGLHPTFRDSKDTRPAALPDRAGPR